MAEMWRDVDGWPYAVSSMGRVRRHGRVRCLRPGTSKGYFHVSLCHNGARKTSTVHKLVAAAFLGPRPDGLETNHKDGNKLNNQVGNLEYVTRSENSRHAFRLGLREMPPIENRLGPHNPARGERHGHAKLCRYQVGKIRMMFAGGLRVNEIARHFHVNPGTISLITRGKTWKHLLT